MKIVQQANTYYFINNENAFILDELPVGIFNLVETRQGLVLEKREETKFNVIDETYGKLPVLRKKLYNDINRHNKLGILFVGEKGSGKSLLAKQLCNDTNLPVIIIKENFKNCDLEEFINNIPNKFILFIDEFEKIFPLNDRSEEKEDMQNKLLPIFDGICKSNFISILTANDKYKISEFFKNRTKRIKYYIEFESITKEDIEEFVKAKKIDSVTKDKIINLNFIVNKLNYDILTEIIDELNVYPNYTINDLLEYLNIEISMQEYEIYCYSPLISKGEICIATYERNCNPFLGFNFDRRPRIDGKYIENERQDIIEIDNYFKNNEYKIDIDGDDIQVVLKEDFINEDYNLGKLIFIFKKQKINKLLI